MRFGPIIMETVLLETRFVEYLSRLKITVGGRNTNEGDVIEEKWLQFDSLQ